jgi:lipopolysaccharide transport system permease protein
MKIMPQALHITARLKAIVSSKDLIRALILKNIKVRYTQSLIGPLWVFLQPLILMLLFVMIQIFTGIPSNDSPYPIFVFSALVPWSFFSNAIIFSSGSIVDNSPIIKKIYCPREVFPISSILASLFDFIAAFAVFALLMFFYNMPFTSYVLALPLLIVIQLLLITAIALISSAVAVYKRDIIIGMPFIMQFWLFASPVMYSVSSVPEKWKTFYLLNPMAGLIEAYRSILIYGKIPELSILLTVACETTAALIAGFYIFGKLEKRFADVI